MVDWRIYYADGSTFDSSEGEPHKAPSEFFICALGYDPATGERYIMSGYNYYRYDEENKQWWGFDDLGLHSRLRHNLPIYAYKEGFTITKTAFNKLHDKAHKDPDFPMVIRK